MVAKITTPVSINRALNYNEQKVQKGVAKCLFAGNFLQAGNEMNFYQKLGRFQNLIEKNSSKTNTLHISLNFHPSENFSEEKMIAIAETYMNKIGFGDQPFLVYQHFDAGHPHLHVVTTTIKEDGRRIDTYNIGKNQSQNARKEIESMYGLVKANDATQTQKKGNVVLASRKIKYGAAETKRSITNVLANILTQYKFTSIAELNAVLKLYNVTADNGSEDSRIFKNHGLNYRLINDSGDKIGIPIKASSIYLKPTLSFLEKKFEVNKVSRAPFKAKLKTAIDWTVQSRPASISDFVSRLQREKVTAILRENEQGFLYGITFIDHRNKTVFNGSDLGKGYSAAGLKERITINLTGEKSSSINLLNRQPFHPLQQKDLSTEQSSSPENGLSNSFWTNENLLQLLLDKEKMEARLPFGWIKKKKKRRKPKL